MQTAVDWDGFYGLKINPLKGESMSMSHPHNHTQTVATGQITSGTVLFSKASLSKPKGVTDDKHRPVD